MGDEDVGGIVGDEFDNHNDSTAKSGVDITMYTTTLTHVLDLVNAPKRIDYMSLDIEGAEYHALKGFDFRRYTIDLITVERPIRYWPRMGIGTSTRLVEDSVSVCMCMNPKATFAI